MDITNPSPEESSRARPCSLCRTQNADWLTHCIHCGAALPQPEQAKQAEMAHITYLLWQIPLWRSRSVLSPEAEANLRDEYSRRYNLLSEHSRIAEAVSQNRVAPTPVVPPLPLDLHPSSVTSSDAIIDPVGLRSSEWQAAKEASVTPPAAEPAFPIAPPAQPLRGIAVFFQEHGLKIVFALATLLVLIALRSILGWEQTSGITHALLPLLPLGLTVMFWQFGRRTQQDNPWAAFVYQALTAVLLAVDLHVGHRYWLGMAGLVIPPKILGFCSCALGLTAVGVCWRHNRYVPMLHLLQFGSLVTLYSGLQCVRLLLWNSADSRPEPLLLFGLSYLTLAGIYFLRAQFTEPYSEDDSVPSPPDTQSLHPMWILWANVSVTVAFLLSALSLTLHGGFGRDEFLLVIFLGGLLYGVIGQMLANSRMVTTATCLTLIGGLSWLTQHTNLGSSLYGALFAAVGAVSFAVYAYNRQITGTAGLRHAWLQSASAANSIGLLVIGVRTLLSLFHVIPDANSADAWTASGIVLVCGLLFVLAASLESEPQYGYPACISGTLALLCILEALHAPPAFYPFALSLLGGLMLVPSHFPPSRDVLQRAGLTSLFQPFDESGRIVIATSLVFASLLAIGTPHNGWLIATLFHCAVLYGLMSVRESGRRSIYVSLIAAAFASILLTAYLTPRLHTPADCMLPFALLTAVAVWGISRRTPSAGGADSISGERGYERWLDPLTDAALLSLLGGMIGAYSSCITQPPLKHLLLECAGFTAVALLITFGRRKTDRDVRRYAGLIGLNLATGLGIAHVTGLDAKPLTAGFPAYHFACGLMIQSWLYWLAARLLPRHSEPEAWSEELSQIAMGVATVSAFLAGGTALFLSYSFVAVSFPIIVLLGAGFALACLETWRTRQADYLALSGISLLLTGVIFALDTTHQLPLPAFSLACFSVVSAGAYLTLGRRLNNSIIPLLAALPVMGGIALSFLLHFTRGFTDTDTTLANVLWIVGGLGVCAGYLFTARWTGQARYVYSAAFTAIGVYLRAVIWMCHPHPVWYGLWMLPLLAAMAYAAQRPPREWERLLTPALGNVGIVAVVASIAWTIAVGDWRYASEALHTSGVVTLTLATFGLALLLLAGIRKTPKALTLGAVVLTMAYHHLLFSKTSLLSAAPTLHWSLFAFLAIQPGLLWLATGWFLKSRTHRLDLGAPLLTLSAGIALFSGVTALLSLPTHQQGTFSILTLAWGGAIWFGLWLAEQGEFCLHIGTGNLVVAWGLLIYHYFGAESSLLDIYLLPVGVYMLVLGHLVSRRQQQSRAQGFWWVGLLLVLTPAFLTHWEHAPGWHTALFLIECTVCVLWGVAQRVRAFVGAGLGFVALYAAAVVQGSLPDVVTTVLALLAGVSLFVVGFYSLTHREQMRQMAESLQRRWAGWSAWR